MKPPEGPPTLACLERLPLAERVTRLRWFELQRNLEDARAQVIRVARALSCCPDERPLQASLRIAVAALDARLENVEQHRKARQEQKDV